MEGCTRWPVSIPASVQFDVSRGVVRACMCRLLVLVDSVVMGCASSGPLAKMVDGAKDTAHDVAHMGEDALHGAGDAAKDGMDHIKSAMDSAVHSVEDGLGTVMHKIEDTIGHKKDEAKDMAGDMADAVDGLEASADEMTTKVAEEISDAETVLASEAEDTKDMLLAKAESIKEAVHPTEDTLTVEDIEEVVDDGMGSTVVVEEKKEVEELMAKIPTPAPTPPPEMKEEPLTPWELAADNIVYYPLNPSEPNQESAKVVTVPAVTDAQPADEQLAEAFEETSRNENHQETVVC